MTLFGVDLSWLDVLRLVVSLAFLVFMACMSIVLVQNTRWLRQLLTQGQDDKHARELAVQDLLCVADDLVRRTRDALDISDTHTDLLSKKIDENTEITIKAAEASATAAEAAVKIANGGKS